MYYSWFDYDTTKKTILWITVSSSLYLEMENANNAHTFDQGADPALYGQPPHLQCAQPG
jgi:hypothetical protein